MSRYRVENEKRFLKIHTRVCVCVCVCVWVLGCLCLFMTPWTVACQTSLSMVFSGQEYWSGLPFPIPADWMEAASPVSPTSAGGFFTTASPGKQFLMNLVKNQIWGWLNLVNQVFITEHNGCYGVLPRFFIQGRKQINKHLNHLSAARKQSQLPGWLSRLPWGKRDNFLSGMPSS